MICLVTHSLGIKLDKLLFSSLLGGSSVLSNSPKASNPTSTEKIKLNTRRFQSKKLDSIERKSSLQEI
jgi:hypothetical protein